MCLVIKQNIVLLQVTIRSRLQSVLDIRYFDLLVVQLREHQVALAVVCEVGDGVGGRVHVGRAAVRHRVIDVHFVTVGVEFVIHAFV